MAHLCRVCARYVVLMEAAVAVGEGHHARNTLRFFLSRWHTVAERRHKIRKVIERTECVCSFPAFCRLLRMGALTRWGVLLLPLVLCPVWAGTPNNNQQPSSCLAMPDANLEPFLPLPAR